MPRRTSSERQEKKTRPATTPEGRENQLIAKAMALAEKQIEDGTASAQVITHYLKLGTSRERLEQERLAHENKLLVARAEAMSSAKEQAILYEEAIKVMRVYSGQDQGDGQDDET